MSEVPITNELIEDVAGRLDLRDPNRDALRSLAYRWEQNFGGDSPVVPWEVVIDAATGMGKTFIAAAIIDYYSVLGSRNFAIIAPGTTILRKTQDNFTLGHPKSVAGGMDKPPVVITSENFNTPSMRAVMDDPDQVKLYVFTVQSLLRPTSKAGKKTHDFQEGLGQAFYEYLDDLEDLVILADEHHMYHGPAFSRAIRDLTPKALIGLTATPDEDRLRRDEIPVIFRYPLAAAIAEKYVKTPILVGRHDDRGDARTKIEDGLKLLEAKEASVEAYCRETGAEPINPIMLVVAPTIDDAEEIGELLRDPSVAGGRYGEHVLVVNSKSPDEALEKLDQAEHPNSGVRVIVSVGMLREGWDNKAVYVICSLRASISDVLTEQTMGRGLRLPFGDYTDWEMLDTLEIVAHESYEKLLKRADVINEKFIDWRTHAVERRNQHGEVVITLEQEQVSLDVIPTGEQTPASTSEAIGGGSPTLTGFNERLEEAEAGIIASERELLPRPDAPVFQLPALKMSAIENPWSLNNITDLTAFRAAGERFTDPQSELRRIKIGARIITGTDGLKRTEVVPASPIDKVEAQMSLIPLEEAKQNLVDIVMAAPAVPGRRGERQAANRLVDAFVQGLGVDAEKLLSSYADRAGKAIIDLVSSEQAKGNQEPTFNEVVELRSFNAVRRPRPETSTDRIGAFSKATGYIGFEKSVYDQDWFDSSTERDLANILDDAGSITGWLRLQRGDLEIEREGGTYNPDFAAIDTDGRHYLIEVKADNQMASGDVQGKREAAKRWANQVNSSSNGDADWSYILAGESEIKDARGSWDALRALAGA